jgi:glutamate-1-semialdehyde 2,1-aminomutase
MVPKWQGFRYGMQGAGIEFGVKADLLTFGKAIGNGFSVAALTGKKEIMNLGGINETGQERVFLLSSTHGAEMASLGALMAVIDFYKCNNVINHIWKYGNMLKEQINKISKELDIINYFYVDGIDCLPFYVTLDENKQSSLKYKTLFIQEMIKNNVLIPYITISYSFGDNELQQLTDAIYNSLIVYKKALDEGIDNYLTSEIVKPVFRKYN